MDTTPRLPASRPDQAPALWNFLALALSECALTDAEVQYLLANGAGLKEALKQLLWETARPFLVIGRLPATSLPNPDIPLSELVRNSNLRLPAETERLLPATDPARPEADEYQVVTFRSGTPGSRVQEILRAHARRAATLREALSLLQAHPALLAAHPTLHVYGSAMTGDRGRHACLRRAGEELLLTAEPPDALRFQEDCVLAANATRRP